MTTVPNASGAIVAPAKVQTFLLNESHAGNRGRAEFFLLFGFNAARWEALCDALVAHVAANQVVEIETTQHGTNYTVRCSLPSPDGRDPCIFTVWTIEPSRGPKFVTAFPGTPPRPTP
jgi:hypothetical protein